MLQGTNPHLDDRQGVELTVWYPENESEGRTSNVERRTTICAVQRRWYIKEGIGFSEERTIGEEKHQEPGEKATETRKKTVGKSLFGDV